MIKSYNNMLTSSNFMPSASYTGGASTTITFYHNF